jgi:hypothetical protein
MATTKRTTRSTLPKPSRSKTSAPTRRAAAKPKAAPATPSAMAGRDDGLARQLLDGVEALDRSQYDASYIPRFKKTPAWKKVAGAPPEIRAGVAVEAFRRLGALRRSIKGPVRDARLHHSPLYSFARMSALSQLFRKTLPLGENDWELVLAELARFEWNGVAGMDFLPSLATAFKRYADKHGITDRMAASRDAVVKSLSHPATTGFKEKPVIAKLRSAG